MKLPVRIEAFLVILFSIQSCAPFGTLPQKTDRENKIMGVYSNDCDSTSNRYLKQRLWEKIDLKNSIDKDSLLVRFEITEDMKLKAQLLNDKELLQEKIIKGKFKEDGCFYTRRQFYIIPILPILFAYSNKQKRIYLIDNSLVFEMTYNSGGAVIIMASGNSDSNKWFYTKYRD